jgi:uncharacterized RDD family membrane protein YckC
MQALRSTEQTEYASLGWRFLAVLIDSVALFAVLVAVYGALAVAGALEIDTTTPADPFDQAIPPWLYVVTYAVVFVYYTFFELLTSSSPGKLALKMRVTTDDGARPGAGPIVVRNLVRIPEVFLYYLPAAVSVLASSRNKRLGDLAAGTVVLRRGARPATADAGPAQAPPWGTAPQQVQPTAPAAYAPAAFGATPASTLDDALGALKAAALTLRGAHHNYLLLSEREIARGGGVTAGFSPEYAAAWHTLADAVIALQQANGAAARAAASAGVSLDEACGAHPDLLVLCAELSPYFTAAGDEDVQEAYLAVARSLPPA